MRSGFIHRQDATLVRLVWHAERWWSRLRGLLFRAPLCPDGSEGLLITPCASVHTLGMGYPIDIVFMDRAGRVLRCHEDVRPGRVRMQRGARSALELAAGAVRVHGIGRGDVLAWTPSGSGGGSGNG